VSKFRKELLIGLAVFVPIFAVVLLWRPGQKISFLDLRIVNDTQRTVTVQPCWDADCLDIHGLHAAVLRPGRSVHATNQWPTDVGQGLIVVGIRKPSGNPRTFSACIVTASAPGQKTGLVRVSHARPCLTGTEP
jgi:hypothetical protein